MGQSIWIKAALALVVAMVGVTAVATVVRNRSAATTRSAETVSAPVATAVPAPAAPAPPPPPKTPAALRIGEESFTPRRILDPANSNMPALSFLVPQSWRDRGSVRWEKDNDATPAVIHFTAENPANAEAFYLYGRWAWFTLRPDGGKLFKNGVSYRGAIKGNPLSPQDTMAAFIKTVRGNEPGFHVIGSRELPNLGKGLGAQFSDRDQGIAVKVSYQLQGQPVEEEFNGIYYRQEIAPPHSNGRLFQVNWGLGLVHSFRAPAGTLDSRRRVFTTIAESRRVNPDWAARVAQFSQASGADFNRGLQRTYDSIAAAKRTSAATVARSNAFLANVERSLAQSHAAAAPAGAPPAEGRSTADTFDDYVRGVDTTVDPNTGTSQHDNSQQYHWTDSNGAFRNSNDGTYDPNQHENGSWTLMHSAK
jgi:hypothetical protein